MAGHNTTCYNDSERTFYFVYDVLTTTLAFTITITNLVVIFIFCCNTKIQSKTANLLLCDQFLVDLFNGAVAGGITVFQSSAPEKVKASIYQLSIALSLHTVALISVERYIFILKPFYHRTHVTVKKVSVAIVVSWCSSLVWIPCRLVHYNSERAVNWKSYVWFIAISDAFIFLLITCMGILHVLTFKGVKACIKQRYEFSISQRNKKNFIDGEKLKRRIRMMRVTKIFIAMFLAFILTYAPVFLTGIVFVSGGFAYIDECDKKYFSLDLLFFLATSVFNPVVTLVFKEDYRKVIYKMLYAIKSNQMFKTNSVPDGYPLSPRNLRHETANGSHCTPRSSSYTGKKGIKEGRKDGKACAYFEVKTYQDGNSALQHTRIDSVDSSGDILGDFVARALTYTFPSLHQSNPLILTSTSV